MTIRLTVYVAAPSRLKESVTKFPCWENGRRVCSTVVPLVRPGLAPSGCGIFDVKVPDERVVHNMEHGHIVISYNLPDQQEVDNLIALAEGLPDLDRWALCGHIQRSSPALWPSRRGASWIPRKGLTLTR